MGEGIRSHFGNIFSDEGYAVGYYGYLWADVLTSDAAEAFQEAPGGFYDKELAGKLVDHLFAVRNAVDPAGAYRAFPTARRRPTHSCAAKALRYPGPQVKTHLSSKIAARASADSDCKTSDDMAYSLKEEKRTTCHMIQG